MIETGFPARGLPEKEESYRYLLTPRAKPQYHSVVDAQRLFGGMDRRGTAAHFRTWSEGGGGEAKLYFHTTLQLPDGTAEERVRFGNRAGMLLTETVDRLVTNHEGRPVHEERAEFHQGPYPFPTDIYPEVYAPFLMRGDPVPRNKRIFHSWISDRFVARIYIELHRKHSVVEVPAGRIACSELLIYPDINDWVPLGIIATLAKPILPRYYAWLALEPPHQVVRFEGAYGPPGAPEVVVELLSID